MVDEMDKSEYWRWNLPMENQMSPVYSELVKEPNYHVLAQLTTQNVVCVF